MTWCDKLASTPGIGVRLSPHFASGDSIIDGLSRRVLSGLTEGKNSDLRFTVEQVTPFGLNLATNDGFSYQIDHRSFAVVFNYRLRAEPSSAGPPQMKLLSVPAPFSDLLPVVTQKLIEGILAMPAVLERTIVRVGVIATTNVARADAPPGVGRMIDYFSRPWGKLDHLNFNIFGELADTEQWTDRCSHNLSVPEDLEKVLTLTLDFQRRFKAPAKVSEDRLKQFCRNVSEDAVAYFERVAEGSMFDEELLSSAER